VSQDDVWSYHPAMLSRPSGPHRKERRNMELHMPSPEVIPFGLRAMKMVAMANGRFDKAERDLLAAAQAALGASHDLDALAPIDPAELAAAVPDQRLREQIVSGLIVMTLIDGEASTEEASLVERF